MRRVSRKFKRHFGVASKHMSVRSHRVWYWQLLTGLAYIVVGYLIAYWYLTGGNFGSLTTDMMRVLEDNQRLLAKAVQTERQLQVAQAAQSTLAKELSDMQDESIRLKEDVAFYKNILNENDTANELKLYSFKVLKSAQPRQYEYHILLIQSGRHDKTVQAKLNLMLNATKGDQAVRLPLSDGVNTTQVIPVNFKYYQRIDGSFVVPKDAIAHTLELGLVEESASQPNKAKINQKLDLPN